MNNPFDYIPDAACEEAFGELLERLEILKMSDNPDDVRFCRELEAGKMLGMLIATDSHGVRHTLYAFSGQLGDGGFLYHGFTGPVFDYLQPDGYFKTKEREISRLNLEIAMFEDRSLAKAREDFEDAKERMNDTVAEYKEICRISKLERDAKRKSGGIEEEVLAALIRQSQFEKAELRRIKKRASIELEPYASKLKEAKSHLLALKERRREESEALQKWLFANFKVTNAKGESRSLRDIFNDTPLKVPPSGAGECCGPKLLQEAYRYGWKPVAMAEYWYGKPKGGNVRIHGRHYPACRGKCLPILSWMLQGLSIEPPLGSDYISATMTHTPEIIYENQWFCVVNKPSGMLSVPGKGTALSVEQWLKEKYGIDREVKMAHRLDQDTSGLLIATFGLIPFKVMQSLFAMRRVKKMYVAELDGDYESSDLSREGRIDLPLYPDWFDRPRQRVDPVHGKEAITDYEFISATGGRSRIVFHPLTGRTHQLRVHAASEMGLGMPIAGDRLYGKIVSENPAGRLMLHAWRIEFTFPIDGQHYSFEAPAPF